MVSTLSNSLTSRLLPNSVVRRPFTNQAQINKINEKISHFVDCYIASIKLGSVAGFTIFGCSAAIEFANLSQDSVDMLYIPIYSVTRGVFGGALGAIYVAFFLSLFWLVLL